MSTAVVLQQMIVIIIMIAVGYALYKTKKITDEASRVISFLVVSITNPALAISSAFQDDMSISHGDILLGIGVAAIMFAVCIAFGHIISSLLCREKNKRKMYIMMNVYSNLGFIGIPVVTAVLGSQAMVFVTISIIIFNILFYTHGYAVMLSGVEGADFKLSWKTFINVGTVSGVIAILVFWFRLRFPAIIEDTLTYSGRATTFLAMMVLGVSLARVPVKRLFSDKKLYIIWAVRYIAFPIAFTLILKSVFGSTLMVKSIGILSAMPVGNMPLMLANRYGMETETLSSGTFITTIASILTVTLTTMVL